VIHNAESPRLSVPFFFDPNWDAYIEPVLPATDGEADGQYHGVRYQDKFIAAIEQPLSAVAPLPG
jgi:isopenicillin N synthase-like dioxygenase